MNSEELREAYGADLVIGEARTPFDKVREFHEVYGHPIAESPRFVTGERLDLRLALIEEEWSEVLESLEGDDLANFAKELADLIYVINGLALEAGIDLDAVFTEVHRSNMSKLGDDGNPIYREDGKVLKGPNYSEADVASVLGL